MEAVVSRKFGFRIRTRAGLVVDNLRIPGRDVGEAERKVQQLYRDCVILERYGCADSADMDALIYGGRARRYG